MSDRVYHRPGRGRGPVMITNWVLGKHQGSPSSGSTRLSTCPQPSPAGSSPVSLTRGLVWLILLTLISAFCWHHFNLVSAGPKWITQQAARPCFMSILHSPAIRHQPAWSLDRCGLAQTDKSQYSLSTVNSLGHDWQERIITVAMTSHHIVYPRHVSWHLVTLTASRWLTQLASLVTALRPVSRPAPPRLNPVLCSVFRARPWLVLLVTLPRACSQVFPILIAWCVRSSLLL